MLYLTLLKELAPDYKLYIAITDKTYHQAFETGIIKFVAQQNKVPFIVVNIKREEIVTWINW